MAEPIAAAPSVRLQRPWTVSAGLGSPDLVRVDLTYSINDAFTVGGALGFGPLGAMGSANGLFHALRSPNHGHSLTLGVGLAVAPGIAQMAGNGAYVGADANLGWEYRSEACGFTSRLSVGPALYAGFGGPQPEVFVVPKAVATVGWSF